MDRISDSDSEGTGSIPVGTTRKGKLLQNADCPFLFASKSCSYFFQQYLLTDEAEMKYKDIGEVACGRAHF
jgi:hypothetical protein